MFIITVKGDYRVAVNTEILGASKVLQEILTDNTKENEGSVHFENIEPVTLRHVIRFLELHHRINMRPLGNVRNPVTQP